MRCSSSALPLMGPPRRKRPARAGRGMTDAAGRLPCHLWMTPYCLRIQVHVRAAERAVRLTSVQSTCVSPASMNSATARHNGTADWRTQPCVATQGVPASSSRTSKASAMRPLPKCRSQRRTHPVRSRRRCRRPPVPRPGRAHPAPRRSRQSAAHLQLHACLRGERCDHRAVAAAALAGTVQIDDVQPVGAISRYRASSSRVRFIARLCREVALEKPHAASAAQVDGGISARRVRHRRAGGSPGNSSTGRADVSGALRMKLGAEKIAPRHAGEKLPP